MKAAGLAMQVPLRDAVGNPIEAENEEPPAVPGAGGDVGNAEGAGDDGAEGADPLVA